MTKCKCCEDSGKDIRVSFCPKCKSREVGYVFGLGNLFGVMPKMSCRDCGFSNPIFPVLIANEEELKKAVEGMKKRGVAKKKVEGMKKRGVAKKKVVRRKKK